MKILHVTYHQGCKISVDFMCRMLGYEITTQMADWNYNISESLANEIWNKHKDYYNSFDCVITSDTAPISRIFLQNNFSKKLIIWVCNRFDYSDAATNLCAFPDEKYYDLFRTVSERPNVTIRSYTKFEHEYAEHWRGIKWSEEVLRPCTEIPRTDKPLHFPDGTLKENVFFITRYHNDNYFMNLKIMCNHLGITTYKGAYDGAGDLYGIKGIIHIPYAWSNLALFENWAIGNVYFIPSEKFLFELKSQGDFFWSPPLKQSFINSSEWYLPEHKDLFLYFDNWNHLKELTENTSLIKEKKIAVAEYSKQHNIKVLSQWKEIIEK